MATVTITAITPQPPLQVQEGDTVTFRGWYTNSFVAIDGVTPVEGGNGLTGFFYEWDCSINDDGFPVVPALEVQPTTGSNPTAGFFGALFVNGSFAQMIIGTPQATAGWQIPTIYGSTMNFGQLALYNAAVQLLYSPNTFPTFDQVVLLIQELAGGFQYAAVGINGIGQPSVAPVVASIPIFLGENDQSVVRTELLTSNLIPYATAVNELSDSLFSYDGVDSGCQTLNYFQAGDYQFVGNGTRLEVNDTFARANLFAGGDGQNAYAGMAAVCDPNSSSAQVFIQATGYTHFYGDQIGVARMGDTQVDHNGTRIIVDDVNQRISLTNLPTSDPHVADVLWRDGTDLKVSIG